MRDGTKKGWSRKGQGAAELLTGVSVDDQQLLDAARLGDSSALETLLVRHQDRIYGFGMKLCRNPEDAEDVLQETRFSCSATWRD